jgi:hypothetical protein
VILLHSEKLSIKNKKAHKSKLLIIDKPHNLIWITQVFQIRNVHISVIGKKNPERDARSPKIGGTQNKYLKNEEY